jgi:hypothetical protein
MNQSLLDMLYFVRGFSFFDFEFCDVEDADDNAIVVVVGDVVVVVVVVVVVLLKWLPSA